MRELAGMCLLSLAACCGWAADKYDLRLRLRVGESWAFEQVADGYQKAHMTSPGVPPLDTDDRMHSIRKGTLTVLEASNGIPTAVRVAFDPACITMLDRLEDMQKKEFPLAGATVTLRRDAKGELQPKVEGDTKRELDAETKRELEAYLNSKNDERPEHPVALGESWQPDLKQIRESYQLTAQDKATGTAKLTTITNLLGRRAAEIALSASVSKRQLDMQLTEQLNGSVWYDLETGRVLQSNLDGSSTGKGVQPMPTPSGQMVRVNVDRTGMSQLRLTTGPAGEASKTAPVASAETVPQAPKPPSATKPESPQAAQPVLSQWAGTFRDEQITLELKPTNADAFDGAILFKGQKFPVTAHEANGELKGEFKTDAGAFEFAMKPDGKAYAFTTGNRTYQLNKQGLNPLGDK